MKLIAVPTDENALTMTGDFLVIRFPLDWKLDPNQGQLLEAAKHTIGTVVAKMPAEIVLQLMEQGEFTGSWSHMLWEYAYASDVQVLHPAKRRGHTIWAEHVEHMDANVDGPGPERYKRSVSHVLFFELEREDACHV